MNDLEKTIQNMDFEFFANGQHKIEPEDFLKTRNAIFLDVRSKEEIETIQFHLKHHVKKIEIPAHDVPSHIDEIPKDNLIGVFCSSGVRCVMIFLYLKSKGFENVKILEGGYAKLFPALMPGKIYKHLKQ